MEFYYNPLSKRCKSIIGGIRDNEKLNIKIFTNANQVFLRIKDDYSDYKTIECGKVSDGFKTTLEPLTPGIYWYHFVADGLIYGCGNSLYAEKQTSCVDFQILVYSSNYCTPEWFKGSIMYQIFPDRFAINDKYYNSLNRKTKEWYDEPDYLPDENGKILNNDFYCGNFKGIEDKLTYLKELGVSVVYLNPITLSNSNHRYDTGDYLKIDPMLGSLKDFKDLIKKANLLGIKIILDGVFNHTGDDSKYFNKYNNYKSIGAYQSKDSKFYSWYTFENYPDEYKSWWGVKTLPTINKESLEFENFITENVLPKYLNLGVNGVRLDVVDELPSSFVKKIRKCTKDINHENILIGEVWEDATNKIAYNTRKQYFNGDELDSVMNYPIKNAILSYILKNDSSAINNTVLTEINNYPKDALDCLMNIVGTHDTTRILTTLGRENMPLTREDKAKSKLTSSQYVLAISRLRIAAILQFFLPGVPCIYYGDETGMEGERDPFNRRTFKWDNINKEIFDFYSKISKIRTRFICFKDGDLNVLYSKNGAFVFERIKNNERVIIATNVGYNIINITGSFIDLYNNKEIEFVELSNLDFAILKDNDYGN